MYRLIYIQKHLQNAKHGQPQPYKSPASLSVKSHMWTKAADKRNKHEKHRRLQYCVMHCAR